MKNFKQNNRFGGRNSGRSEMYKVVCDACGKDCEVPFKPTGDKPVYCNDCFRNKRNDEPRRSSGRDSGRFGSSDKIMHKAICDKCGKECEVPFRPTGDKPVYCSDCFNKGDRGSDRGSNRGSGQAGGGQLDIINAKLDKILKALVPDVPAEVDEKKEPSKKIKISKPKKTSKGKDKKKVSPKKPKTKAKTKAKAK